MNEGRTRQWHARGQGADPVDQLIFVSSDALAALGTSDAVLEGQRTPSSLSTSQLTFVPSTDVTYLSSRFYASTRADGHYFKSLLRTLNDLVLMVHDLRRASLAALLAILFALPTTFAVYNGSFCGDVETSTYPGEPFPGSSFAGVVCADRQFFFLAPRTSVRLLSCALNLSAAP